MGNLLKIVIFPLVIATFLTGCGGGSKPPVDNTPPPPALSSNASLSNLTVSTGSFNEVFSSGTYAYTQNTGASELSVTPILSDANASVTANGVAVASGSASGQIALALGSNTITVVVTAENGSTTQTYTIAVTRLNNDASLSGLSLSSGDLDQIFQSSLFDYTATVGYQNSSITVSATTTDSNANVTVNGTLVPSGQPSEVISLVEGLNTITVTVTAEDEATTQNYVVSLTRQSVANFAQRAYIKASNTDAANLFSFGHSVALFDDTLAVGVFYEDSAATGVNGDETDKSAANSGAVYVFIRDGAGVWSQQAYIKASNTDAGDWFGYSLALDGDTLVVGARLEDSSATGINGDQNNDRDENYDSGAVYVYSRDNSGIWTQQAYIKASNTEDGSCLPRGCTNDQFGVAVAISGDILAVGAQGEASAATGIGGDQSDNSVNNAGAVYVFGRDNVGDWSQQAYIKAPDNTHSSTLSYGEGFGYNLQLSGNTLVVASADASAATGINGDFTDNSAVRAGAVYVFTHDQTGTWSQQAYIKASNTDEDDRFGSSLDLLDDTLVVGAIYEKSASSGINGDQTDNSIDKAGAIYVFTRDDAGLWSQQAYIKPSNPDAGDHFGWSVALSSNSLVVGAFVEGSSAIGMNGDETDNSAAQSGAVYVFSRDGNGLWDQTGYVKASNTDARDSFGWSVALSEDTLAVGAIGEKSAATGVYGDETDNSAVGAGAVYVFR